jgi:ferredoxin-thioredoxin reductase catalytic chain
MENRVEQRLKKLREDAAVGGYKLNPDDSFVRDLTEGLVTNLDRYGIESCPCRLLEGEPSENMDIVCPCVYRDDDLAEYGACFCGLYVTLGKQTKQVPDRRDQKGAIKGRTAALGAPVNLKFPVYRCTVCGYLCANNHPPQVCPICKAGKERFERFM